MGKGPSLRPLALVLLCLLFGIGSDAFAWGTEGHAVVAHIAEAKLLPPVRRRVQALLALEKVSNLEDIASWADEIRGTRPGLPRHSVRMPLDHSEYDPNRDCGDNLCVIEAIKRYRSALIDPGSTNLDRLEALKFLVHLVGDIHQPLHASVDTGKVEVVLNGRAYTLHKIWDTTAIRSLRTTPDSLAENLIQQNVVAPESCDVENWAMESRDVARDFIFSNVALHSTDARFVVLPDDYCDEILPIVKERLYLAGIRLAWILNSAFTTTIN